MSSADRGTSTESGQGVFDSASTSLFPDVFGLTHVDRANSGPTLDGGTPFA